MAYQGIGTGTTPNDNTGDSLLIGAVKVNSNFQEIYNALGDGGTINFNQNTEIIAGSGLAGGGSLTADRTLNVGAGDGISVDADSVAVDTTVVRTSGDQTIEGSKTFNGVVNIRSALDLADNDILRFGSGDDAEIFCNGSHLYLDLNDGIGNFYIRDGTTTRFTFDDAGDFTASRYIFGQYMNMSHGSSTRTGDTVFYSSYDSYIRKNTASGFRTSLNVPTRTGGGASGTWGINITGNANTLNDLSSTSFLRSDDDDSASGTITFNGVVNIRSALDLADNDILRFGSGDDAEMFCNGSHLYLDLNGGIGNFYIRDGATTRFTFDDNGQFTASSHIFTTYVNMSHGNDTRTGDTVFYSSTDGYIRKNTASGFRDSLNVPTRTGGSASGTWGINITGNANTLNNLSSTSFLRSDDDDSASGTITFNGVVNIRSALDLADNDILRFGSGDDAEMFCNGSHLYLDLNDGIGNFYIRDGATTRFTFDDAGDFTASRNIFAEYMNMSHGSSTRNNDTVFYSSKNDDDYIKKNNASGFRNSLNVPTRTGGSASGTWGINITGTATNCSRSVFAGDGLTGGGKLSANRTLNVGAGTGIDVAANSISINSSYRFPSGTRMLFQQTSAPTGWTKDTTSVDNRALRVVSGTAGSGGSTAFTTVFASGRSVPLPQHNHSASTGGAGSHSHTINDPGHRHNFNAAIETGETKSGDADVECQNENLKTSSATTGISIDAVGNHSHSVSVDNKGNPNATMNFAVRYIDVIIARRD